MAMILLPLDTTKSMLFDIVDHVLIPAATIGGGIASQDGESDKNAFMEIFTH